MTDDLKDRVMTLGYQGQTWVLAEDYRELEAEINDAKATAHERGYYQGKAAGDAFGAAMREHVTRLEAENKALRKAAKECEKVRQDIASGPAPESACFDYEHAILALIDKGLDHE